MISLTIAGWLLTASLGALALTARRRLERVARAEHELRGPLAALHLGVEQVRRGRAGPELASMLEAQLDRSRAGLADLAAALAARDNASSPPRPSVALERLAHNTVAGWAAVAARGGREVRLDWRAGPVEVRADRGRLAQALGNLLANAIEHGGGEVEVRGRRVGRAVRIEVADTGDGGRLGATRPEPVDRHPGHRQVPPPRAPRRGRGLGIATRAVEESGGTLAILTDRSGTTAAVELPLADR